MVRGAAGASSARWSLARHGLRATRGQGCTAALRTLRAQIETASVDERREAVKEGLAHTRALAFECSAGDFGRNAG